MSANDFAVNFYPNTNADAGVMASTVFGIPVSQTWGDLMLWERFLNATHPAHLIELGTGRGGLSLFLALQCMNRGINFVTLDSVNWQPLAGPLYALANVKYVQGDSIESGRALVAEAQRLGGAVALFCDAGDKPREYRELIGMLRPGDFIAVHDWGNEIHPADITGPVAMWDKDVCERTGSITRWFKVGAQ